MTTGIDVSGLDELDAKLKKLAEDFPEIQRAMHEEMAQMLESSVAASLRESAQVSTGTMESWQRSRVGSKGGYAAVSPGKGREGRHSFGKITNAAEHGHTGRKPGTQVHRYRPRRKVLRSRPLKFYAKARTTVGEQAVKIAQKYVDQMIDGLEG